MENILVLVDFTKTSFRSLTQAINLAKMYNSNVNICHISSSPSEEAKEALLKDFKPYIQRLENERIQHEIIIKPGKLFSTVSNLVDKRKPDLVVVGTHGKVGLKQNLFGSAIYKLVKGIHAPTLVLNDDSEISEQGFKKAVLPVAPHFNYMTKVKQTCNVLSKNGKIIIFAIQKPGLELDKAILDNIEATKKYLTRLEIEWEYQEFDSSRFSVGYSKETLSFVEDQGVDLISIMTEESSQNVIFGKTDKENILLNKLGISVLCANDFLG